LHNGGIFLYMKRSVMLTLIVVESDQFSLHEHVECYKIPAATRGALSSMYQMHEHYVEHI